MVGMRAKGLLAQPAACRCKTQALEAERAGTADPSLVRPWPATRLDPCQWPPTATRGVDAGGGELGLLAEHVCPPAGDERVMLPAYSGEVAAKEQEPRGGVR